jgi:hypothetical protein
VSEMQISVEAGEPFATVTHVMYAELHDASFFTPETIR